MRGVSGRLILALLIAAAIAAFFLSGLGDRLSLEGLQGAQRELEQLRSERPLQLAGAFFLLYVAVTGLSVPGAAVMTLAAGALFGLLLGTLIVSLASTLGATLAFLASRYLLRDWVRARFPRQTDRIDRETEKDGAFYLLSLRLIPLFPFFLVNLVMGLTRMRALLYAAVSMLGMLPGTILYVNAGLQLSRIESAGDVLSPALLGSLVLLGLFPLVARWLVGRARRVRAWRGFKRPRSYDRNLVVIGAGAAGLVTSYVAAALRAKVTLIEAGRMGGDCLNTGCVPSKTLIRAARAAHEMRAAGVHGLEAAEPRVDAQRLAARIRSVIATIEPADSAERYRSLGVDVRQGRARIVDPWTVEIDGKERLTTRSIVIATGAEPVVPPVPGLAEAGYWTSDTLWERLAQSEELPRRLAILGGGAIGTELAQAFARLGSKVILVEQADRILPAADAQASALIAEVLRGEGVELRTGAKLVRVEQGRLFLEAEPDPIACDELLVALGRRPRLAGLGLESLGLDPDTFATGEHLDTAFPNLFVAGDVAGPYRFTHAASHQAWHAAANALFGHLRRFRPDYRFLPWTIFTDPEIAQVGHDEASAAKAGIAYEIVHHDLSHLDRAVAEDARRGFVKLLVRPDGDRLIGATIVAAGAGELIAQVTLAMRHGIGLNGVLRTIYAYPTMSEGLRAAAGDWRRAHQPERLLGWVERYLAWRRR